MPSIRVTLARLFPWLCRHQWIIQKQTHLYLRDGEIVRDPAERHCQRCGRIEHSLWPPIEHEWRKGRSPHQ